MKKNEIGRSMVEILGVLAIMGVLTIGGIAGYVYAMQKSKANTITKEVTERAIIASHQLMTQEADTLDMTEFHPESDHDEIIGLETETYVILPEKKHFAVKIDGVDGGVCSRILEIHWAEPVDIWVDNISLDDSCESGPHTMTFIFNKELGDETFKQCEVDSDCAAYGTNLLCNQENQKCYRSNEQALIYDRDGKSYPCRTDYAVRTTDQDACTGVCPNREWIYDNPIGQSGRVGYCIPKCRAGEFPKRTSIGDPDRVKCMACNDPGGNDSYGTIGRNMCSGKCPERYLFQTGFTRNNVCLTNNCPEGKYRCYSGCCACNNSKAQSLCHWYTQDCNAAGSGQLVPSGKDACEACDDPAMGKREVTSRGWCRLKNCPDGYFRNGNDCISCSDKSAIKISPAGNTGPCLSCKDDAGNFMRAVEKETCILGQTCANGQTPNDFGVCGDCPDGYFTYNGKCIACDDSKPYAALSSECAKCDGVKGHKRVMHTVDTGTSTPTLCMRERKDGEFYAYPGTLPCDSQLAPSTYGRHQDCYVCPNRVVVNGYWCAPPCVGGFWGTESNSLYCVSCNDSKSYAFPGYTGVSSCSAACPGQRYTDSTNGNRCSKCPTGSYANTANSCTTCPSDLSTLTTEGACVVCNGLWQNGSCGGSCGDGFYYNERNECVACPMDLSDISGNAVSKQHQCVACHGTWNSTLNVCVVCPSEITDDSCGELNTRRCETCGCGWDNDDNSCIACPQNTSQIKKRSACEACQGTWTVIGGVGNCK